MGCRSVKVDGVRVPDHCRILQCLLVSDAQCLQEVVCVSIVVLHTPLTSHQASLSIISAPLYAKDVAVAIMYERSIVKVRRMLTMCEQL